MDLITLDSPAAPVVGRAKPPYEGNSDRRLSVTNQGSSTYHGEWHPGARCIRRGDEMSQVMQEQQPSMLARAEEIQRQIHLLVGASHLEFAGRHQDEVHADAVS